MQTNHGKILDQKIAHGLLQILPRVKLVLITIVNTGIDVTKAQIGKRYVVTKEAVVP